MLNIIITLIVILSMVSIMILCKLLNGTNNAFKTVTAVVMIIANLVLANIIYSIGQAGSMLEQVSDVMKPIIIFTIFPVNMILMACPIGLQLAKWKLEDIVTRKLINKIILYVIFDIFFIIIECLYIKSYTMQYF